MPETVTMQAANMQTTNSPFLYKAMETVRYYYYDIWNENGDPRVTKYPFMDGGPWNTLLCVLVYLYIVKYAGPQLMKNRKPFELKTPLLIYNLFLVSVNAFFVYNGLLITNYGMDSWKCERVDKTSQSAEDLLKIKLGWLFLMTKFIDFCDTFFFVLRKRDRQLSGLHIFHHSFMGPAVWIGLKFAPGGNSAFTPLINSFVHVVMYSYYAATTFQSLRPFLWWKKYLTQLQLTQFVLIILHSIYSMAVPSCGWPKSFMYLSIMNAFIFFYLFYSFFRSTYKPSPKAPQQQLDSQPETKKVD